MQKSNRGTFDMKHNEGQEVRLHYIMSVVGGFIGCYTLQNRSDIFASAQTGNALKVVMDLLGGNFEQVLIRILALLIYICATALTVLLPKYTKINMHLFCIIIDAAVLISIGFLPLKMDPLIALYPVFFMAAIQWNSFRGAYGYVSSTVFSTNNIRQAAISFTSWLCDRSPGELHKMKFYLGTLLFFHTGVAFSYFASTFTGLKSAWFCLIPLAAAFFLHLRMQKKEMQGKDVPV